MGGLFAFAQAVEIEVPNTANVVRTILPNMSDELASFVDEWEHQEVVHGELLGEVLDKLGITHLPTRDKIPASMRFTGKLAKVSPAMHDVVEHIYLVEAAMSERETEGVYQNGSKKLLELGEDALGLTVVGKIGRQEAAHLGFYRLAAQNQKTHLKPWQVRFAREFIERTYMPVGVRVGPLHKDRQRRFGEVAQELTGGDVVSFTDPVEGLARDLLNANGGELKPFVRRRYEECIEEYKAQVA